MKKVFVVTRFTPNPDYDGAEVDYLGAFTKKKSAQTWLDANQEKYKESEWSTFEIRAVKMLEDDAS